jgi:hypothetical protein
LRFSIADSIIDKRAGRQSGSPAAKSAKLADIQGRVGFGPIRAFAIRLIYTPGAIRAIDLGRTRAPVDSQGWLRLFNHPELP